MVSGPDVVHSTDPRGKSVGGRKACQNGGEIWRVDRLSLDFYPEECSSLHQCDGRGISTGLTEDYSGKLYVPISQKPLSERCKPPRNPFSDWHAKVWSTCKHTFLERHLAVTIRFRGGIYAPEDIEQTKQYVLDHIAQYKTKP